MEKFEYTDKEIVDLIKRFESRSLPKDEWTHPAHLVVAIWYCSKYTEEEAMNHVRENITKHNEAVGTPNTDSLGYHETITKFWMWVAKEFLSMKNYDSLSDATNSFIKSEFGDSHFPFGYYSHDLIVSVRARHEWVEPDKKKMEHLTFANHE